MADDCIFCKIVRGEIPCHKIFEDEHVIAFLDIAKDAFGHTLVIPKTHTTNVFDVSDNALCHVMKAIKKIANHYKKLGFGGVNIVNFSGKEAGQSVFHLHFHILPRKDLKEMQILGNLSGTSQSLEEQQKMLKLD